MPHSAVSCLPTRSDLHQSVAHWEPTRLCKRQMSTQSFRCACVRLGCVCKTIPSSPHFCPWLLSSSPTPCLSRRPSTISDRWDPNLFLKVSSDGAPTTSKGKLFRWLIVLTGEEDCGKSPAREEGEMEEEEEEEERLWKISNHRGKGNGEKCVMTSQIIFLSELANPALQNDGRASQSRSLLVNDGPS
ncbi:hypothetical protein L345_16349, partial [Ophiophagus hannah]